MIRAANAYSSEKEPKRDEVPWAHWLKKRQKGVGIYEGGATFKKGVWRPAPSCAMNAAGATGFCPVCREQSILVIYEYINPIELHEPAAHKTITMTEGEEKVLTVQPMEPYRHKLTVTWYVTDFAVTKGEKPAGEKGNGPPDVDLPGVSGDTGEPDPNDPFPSAEPRGGRGGPAPMWAWGGWRARQDRSSYANKPPGGVRKGKVVKAKGRGASRTPRKHTFSLQDLGPGNWRVTCEVKDETKWVLKDPKHLLKERVTWTVKVAPKPDGSAK